MSLLHEKLTYKIRGLCYQVFKDYGGGHKEVVYQRALGEKLGRDKIAFVREPKLPVRSKDSKAMLGWYQPDFIIEDMIIIELKVGEFISKKAILQLKDYLKNTKYELGLLVNFSPKQCDVQRVLDGSKLHRPWGTDPETPENS